MVDLNKYKPAEDTPYSPLRRFRGMLSEITEEEQQGQRGTYMRIRFGFTDLDVIDTTEPYPFPIATISMGLGKSTSRWGAWWKSAAAVIGSEDINSLVGHIQEWAMLPATLRQPLVDAENNPIPDPRDSKKQAWGEVEVDCWQVVNVNGYSAPKDVTEDLLVMLDGKTDTEWNQAFQSSVLARENVALMSENVARKLLPRLEAEGKATRDAEGVWHRA